MFVNKEVRELLTIGKGLEREFTNVVKTISKQKTKKNRENRNLSGFAVPSLLSDEMYDFLKIDKGLKIPRKDVTKHINEYIVSNQLRDEKDKRIIYPNDVLCKLFNCNKTDHVSYFNLQTLIKHHFVKEPKVDAIQMAAAI